MEVTAGDDHILVRQHDGVVGGGVDLGLHDGSHIADGVLGGMLFVTTDNLAAVEHFAHGGGGLQLTLVGAHHMEALVEGLDAAVEGIQRKRKHHVGLTAQAAGLEEAPHGERAHELGAVQQGETLLALQLNGLPAFLGVDFLDVAATAFVVDVAEAEDGGEHEVGQGAEVAAGAEGPLLVDHGKHIVVVAVDETLHGLQLGAAVAEAEVLGLEQQHETHHILRHFVAHAAGVAHHEVLLQLAELLLADADVAKATETGGHAVDGHLLGLHLLVEVVAAFLDAALGLVAEGQCHLLIDNLLNFLQGEFFFGVDIMNHVMFFGGVMGE